MGKVMKQSTLGFRRSKFKVTRHENENIFEGLAKA